MDTFSIVRKALDGTAADEQAALLKGPISEIARITLAVQTVVDTLTPADGGRYVVGFVDIATAGTDLAGRRIIISSKPLHDPNLSMIEKAVVLATFAAHEIGHTVITRPRAGIIHEHNAHSGYHAVANLADDIILEPWMIDRYPILRDAFTFTGLWVLRNTAKSLPKVEDARWDSTPSRFNTILSATRYAPGTPEIVWANDRARDEAVWARDWAARLIAARLADHTTFLALCDEMWERIRTKEEPPVEEPPEGPVCGPTTPTGEKPEPGDERGNEPGTEPGEEPGDEPGDEPTDEPGDEPGEDEDEPKGKGKGGDEPTDEPTDEPEPKGDEPTDKPGDEPKGDQPTDQPTDKPGDEPGEDEGEGEGEGDDDSRDWDEPGSDDEDANGDPDGGADGGGGDADKDADDLRDEDDWQPDKVDETSHEQSEERDYRADEDEAAVRTYTSSTSITFGKHGTALVTWE